MAQYEDVNESARCFVPHNDEPVEFSLHNELIKLYQEVNKCKNISNQERITLQLDVLREIGYLSR